MRFKWKFGKSRRARKQFQSRKPLHEPLEQRQLLTVVAEANGAYFADEGETIQLSAAGSLGTTYSWDLDGDGIYGDVTGVTVDFTPADNGVYTVGLEVSDGTETATDTATVTVANVSPTVSVSAEYTDVVRGESVEFTLGASDPSSVDEAAGFTFEVDWDGSGVFESFITGQEVKKAFWEIDPQTTVYVKATDKDGGTSSIETVTLDVQEHLIRDNIVYWSGTQGVDEVLFIEDNGQLRADRIKLDGVTVNQEIVLAEATDNIDYIRAYGLGGNDYLAHGSGTAKYRFYGHSGDDTLIGGSQSDSLYGGEHDDYLDGGNGSGDLGDFVDGAEGNDTILGGVGDDTLDGGEEDDLIIIADNGDDLLVDGAEQNDRLEFTTGSGADALDFDILTDSGKLTSILYVNGGSVSLGRFQTIDIETGEGDDQITIRDNALVARSETENNGGQIAFELDAGIGSDDLFLALDSDASSSQEVVVSEDGFSIENTFNSGLVTTLGTYAGFEQLEVDGSSFDDELTLTGNTSAAFVGLTSAKIRGGGGNDELNALHEYLPGVVELRGEAGDDLFVTNGGAVEVVGGIGGQDAWQVDLSASPGAQVVGVYSNGVRVSNDILDWLNDVSPVSETESLEVIGGVNNDTLQVFDSTYDGVFQGSQLHNISLHGGIGNDILKTRGISGYDVELHGGADSDTLDVDLGLGGGVPVTVNMRNGEYDQGFFSSVTSVVTYDSLEFLKIETGAGDDQVSITDDAFFQTYDIDFGTGTDSLTLDLSSNTTGAQTVEVREQNTTVSNSSHNINVDHIGLELLEVDGSSFADSFTLIGDASTAFSGLASVTFRGGAGNDTLNALHEYLPTVELYGEGDNDLFVTNGAAVLVDGGAGTDEWTLNLTDPGHGGQNVKVKNSTVEVMNTELTPAEISMYTSLDKITVLGSLNNDAMEVVGLSSGTWDGAASVVLEGGGGTDTLNAIKEILPSSITLDGQEDADFYNTNGGQVLISDSGSIGQDRWSLFQDNADNGPQVVTVFEDRTKVSNDHLQITNTESFYSGVEEIVVQGGVHADILEVMGLLSGTWGGAQGVTLQGGAGGDILNAGLEILPTSVRLDGQEESDSYGTNGGEVTIDDAGTIGADSWSLLLTDQNNGNQSVTVTQNNVVVDNSHPEINNTTTSYSFLETIIVKTGLHEDTFQVVGQQSGSWNGAGTVELFGGAGNDTLNASYEYLPVVKLYGQGDNDSFGTNGAAVLVDGGAGTNDWTLNLTDPGHGGQNVKVKSSMVEVMNTELTPVEISMYDSLDKITVLGSLNNDTMTVEGLETGPWNGAGTVELFGRAGDDTLNASYEYLPVVKLYGEDDDDSFGTNGAAVLVDGGAGTNDWTLNLTDPGHAGQNVKVKSSMVEVMNTELTPVEISMYDSLDKITVLGSPNDDTMEVEGLVSGPWDGANTVELFGGDGNDTLTVYPGILPTSIELYGEGGDDTFTAAASSASIHGGSGSDTLWVLTEVGAVADEIVVGASLVKNNNTSHEQSYTSIETLNVETFGGFDVVTVETTDSNPYLPANISINTGSDQDTIRIIGTSDDDRFVVSGNTITSSRSVSITGLNHEGLEVHGGTGDDLFRVQTPQNLSYAILVKGEAGIDTLDMSRSALDETDALYPQVQIDEIEILDLSHNEFQTVPTLQASTIADLTSLDLKYNKLDLSDPNELDPLQAFTALTKLNVHGNTIPAGSVPDLEGIAGMLLRVDLAPVGLDKAEQEADAEDAFAAIAKALHYSPLAIYEYVVNQFEIEFYEGLMKGPLATIQTKAGNAWDQSNLLIELLDEVGISSNLVSISLDNPTPGRLGVSIDTIQEWVGATNRAAALRVLGSGLDAAQSDQTEPPVVFFDHAWVGADFSSVGGPSGVQLDPSWKFKDYSSNAAEYLASQNDANSIGQLVPYVSDPATGEYFSEIRDELAYEWYEDQVAEYLVQNNTGLSLADLKYDGTIIPQYFDSLPVWPDGDYRYLKESTLTAYDTFGEAVTENIILAHPTIPEIQTHRVVFSLYEAGSSTDLWANLLQSNELIIPEISLDTIVVRWNGDKPGLYIGDNSAPLLESPDDVTGSIDFTMGIMEPGQTVPEPSRVKTYTRTHGEVIAVGLEANQYTDGLLFDWQDSLNSATIAAISAGSGTGPITGFSQANMGQMLSFAVASYFLRTNRGTDVLDDIFQTKTSQRSISAGIASADPNMTFDDHFNEDVQLPFSPNKLFIDLPQLVHGSASIHFDPGDNPNLYPDDAIQQREVFLDNASAQEHAIWEELTNTPGMSTVKSFQVANDNDINIVTFDHAAWLSMYRSQFEVTMDPKIIASIDGAFTSGATSITSPVAQTDVLDTENEVHDFYGVGYISRSTAPTNRIGYIIVGVDGPSGSGGALAGPNEKVEKKYSTREQPQAYDPVNVATGAVIDDIVDIEIPNIGIPLLFARSYDSASLDSVNEATPTYDAVGDQALGRGWWHTYSDRLVSETDAQTNIQTLTYYDNKGYRYQWTYDVSGSEPALLTSPDNFYGDVTWDEGDSTHTFNQVRTKNGTNRRFHMAAPGGSTLYGYLTEIIDRHGNQLNIQRDAAAGFRITQVYDTDFPSGPDARTLTFSYDANGKLATITDFTNRVWEYTFSGNYLTNVKSPVPDSQVVTEYGYTYYTEPGYQNTLIEGKLKEIVRPDGNAILHTYYPNGRAFQNIDPEGFVQTFSFDLFRNRTWTTDERGNSTIYTYNDDGNLSELIYPDRATETYVWEGGLETQRTDPFGIRTVRTYSTDGLGDLKEVKLEKWSGGQYQTAKVDEDNVPVDLITSYEYQYFQYQGDSPYKHIVSNLFEVTQPTAPGDPLRTTTYHHSNLGNPAELTAIVDAAGYTVFYHYDSNTQGLVQRQTDPRRAINEPNPEAYITSFTYNDAGQVTDTKTWVEDLPGSGNQFIEEAFTFDDRGYLTSTTDGRGNTTTFENDILGRRTEMTLPALNGEPEAARSRLYHYDANGQRTAVDNPDIGADPRVETFEYDARSRLVRQTFLDGTEVRNVYDQAGNTVYVVDVLGRVNETVYDSRNRAVRSVLPDRSSVWQSFDGKGRLVQSTDQLGRSTSFEYDLRDFLVKQVDADPNPGNGTASDVPVWEYAFDAVGNRVSTIDPRNNETTYEYDEISRLTKTIGADPDGNSGTTGDIPIWQYFYDASGNQTKAIDPLLRETVSEFDGVNRVVRTVIKEAGQDKTETTFAYDRAGNLIATVDPRGIALGNPAAYTTTYSYNERNLLEEVDRPDTTVPALQTHISTTEYNNLGRVTAEVDELDRRTEFFYDTLGRVVAVVDPLENISTTEYDDAGRMVASSDALGHRTEYLYDVLGRDIGTIDALGNRTTRAYDIVGNLTSVTDANGNVTRYTYDDLNRLSTEEQVGLPGLRTHTYDTASNLRTVTDRNNKTLEYEYDGLNRVKLEEWRNQPTNGLVSYIAYDYDVGSRLNWVAERTSTDVEFSRITYGYDYADRTTSETFDIDDYPEVTLGYSYDVAGNLITVTDQAGGQNQTQTAYTYDEAGRLTTIAVQDLTQAIVTRQTAHLGYNNADERVSLIRINNVPDPDEFQPATTYAYDDEGLLESIEHKEDPFGASLLKNVLTRDELGRVTDILFDVAGSEKNFSYDYDALGQLLSSDQRATGDIEEQYTYDDLGNRTNPGYDYDDPGVHNQLTSDAVYDYQYDGEGRRKFATEIEIAAGQSYRRLYDYHYDHRGRVDKVTLKDAVTGVPKKTIVYKYDAFDRRIAKEVTENDLPGEPKTVERYVYNGDQILLQYDETNTRTHRYVYGTGIDELLLVETADDFYWTLDDYQGSIRHARNEDGSEGFTREYDAFGNLTDETQFDDQNPVDIIFGYTGRQFDEETGLQYNRARYYDPTNGRFISTDPSGFAGGDANLYRYAGNSPVIFVDPSGLFRQPASSGLTFGLGSGGQYSSAPSGSMTTFSVSGSRALSVANDPSTQTSTPSVTGAFLGSIWDSVKLYDQDDLSRSYNNLRGSGYGVVTGGIVAFASEVGENIGVGNIQNAISGSNRADEDLSTFQRTVDGFLGVAEVGANALGAKGAVAGVKRAYKSTAEFASKNYNKIVDAVEDFGSAVKGTWNSFTSWISPKSGGGTKIPNSQLQSPPSSRGRAPTGNDGYPVELHHRNQSPAGPLDEMTRTDHRLGENFRKNHPNTGQDPSKIDRKEWNNQRNQYWKDEYDSGRFDNFDR